MPAERVSMRRIREVLRLKHEGGASERQIARSLSLARSTVALTLERATAAGLRRPRHSARRAAQDRTRLGPGPSRTAPARRHPDAAVGGIRQREPDGYGYSR